MNMAILDFLFPSLHSSIPLQSCLLQFSSTKKREVPFAYANSMFAAWSYNDLTYLYFYIEMYKKKIIGGVGKLVYLVP